MEHKLEATSNLAKAEAVGAHQGRPEGEGVRKCQGAGKGGQV